MEQLLESWINPRIALTLLFLVLGIVCLWTFVNGWRIDSVKYMGPPGGRIDREEEPDMYWFVMALELVLALGCLWLFCVGAGILPEPRF